MTVVCPEGYLVDYFVEYQRYVNSCMAMLSIYTLHAEHHELMKQIVECLLDWENV